jgi:hypothetical protein
VADKSVEQIGYWRQRVETLVETICSVARSGPYEAWKREALQNAHDQIRRDQWFLEQSVPQLHAAVLERGLSPAPFADLVNAVADAVDGLYKSSRADADYLARVHRQADQAAATLAEMFSRSGAPAREDARELVKLGFAPATVRLLIAHDVSGGDAEGTAKRAVRARVIDDWAFDVDGNLWVKWANGYPKKDTVERGTKKRRISK